MLQRSLTVIGLRTKVAARAGPKRSARSIGSNAKIDRDNAPPVVPSTSTSSSAMMKMKPSKPSETAEILKHLNAYFPINPTRYDLDETTLTNVQWRESGRSKEVCIYHSFLPYTFIGNFHLQAQKRKRFKLPTYWIHQIIIFCRLP
jgi:hypothetical protein